MEPTAATATEARALLSTTAAGESSQKAVKKKEPPDTPPQVRKKTRTLYRTDQLKELERMFQEDHYPDSDKRREIALAVGVTPQRIMVWFQNRRAKWRKVERLNSKGNKTNLEIPVSTSASLDNLNDSVPEFPSPQPIIMESGNFSNQLVPPPVTFPPESNLLMCDQPGALSQHNDEAQRVEVAPLLFSPPPVRRASLPLNLGPVHTPHLVPLLLETPNSGFSPKDGSSGSWETSITPGSTYNYSEQMESQYHHQGNQSRSFQLSHYSQHQLFHQSQPHLPQFHPFPFPLPQTLTPPPPQGDPSSAALLAFAYGSDGETPTGLFSGPPAGQLLLQQPSGNLGPLTALQPIPWNDPCLPELSLPGSLCSQNFGPHSGGGSYIPDLAAHVLERQLSPGFIQLLGGSKTGSGLPSDSREELSSGSQEHLSLPKEVSDGVKNTQLPRIAANEDSIPEKNED